MYALTILIGLTFLAVIAEAFFGIPTIQAARKAVNRNFVGRGYKRFFLVTAALSLIPYAIGIALMGPFLGIYNAAIQVACMYACIVMAGILSSWLYFARNVWVSFSSARPSGDGTVSAFRGTVFLVALWGVMGSMTFYDHARSGPLVGVNISLPTQSNTH